MRITATMLDLNKQDWKFLHRVVQTSYEIPENVDRVCLTFSRGAEDRHVELPMHTYASVLTGLALSRAMGQAGASIKRGAERLAATLENQRNAADPVRKTERYQDVQDREVLGWAD